MIRYNSFNGKFFYEMTQPELEYCMKVISDIIAVYNPNSAATSKLDRERNDELWQAYRNCNFCLNKLLLR